MATPLANAQVTQERVGSKITFGIVPLNSSGVIVDATAGSGGSLSNPSPTTPFANVQVTTLAVGSKSAIGIVIYNSAGSIIDS